MNRRLRRSRSGSGMNLAAATTSGSHSNIGAIPHRENYVTENTNAQTTSTTTSNQQEKQRTSDCAAAYEMYNIYGDVEGAGNLLASHESAEGYNATTARYSAVCYNSMIFKYLAGGGEKGNDVTSVEFVRNLEFAESTFLEKANDNVTPSRARKLRRNHWIATYNRALLLFGLDAKQKCITVCNKLLEPYIEGKESELPDEFQLVAPRVAFLMIECILDAAVHQHATADECTSILSLSYASKIVQWLDRPDVNCDQSPLFKFLAAVYRGRLEVAQPDMFTKKKSEMRIRSARKELKTAMEVFQHRLRQVYGVSSNAGNDAGSVASTHSEGDATHGSTSSPLPAPLPSLVLQKLNESVLNLKAYLEQLKGNTKKSLVLCAEAHATITFNDRTYEAIHGNNVAVVYGAIDKCNLARHSLTKAFRNAVLENGACSYLTQAPFSSDGTVRRDVSNQILFNVAVCNLRSRQFFAAYECLAICIAREKWQQNTSAVADSGSNMFSTQTKCWLLLVEACVGIYSTSCRAQQTKRTNIQVNG
jgi:hypothetical protein